MITGYSVERWNGATSSANGEDSWRFLLSHEDVVEPGRVRAFSVNNNGNDYRIELDPNDRFNFVRRTRLLQQPGQELEFVGTRVIFGKHRPDGMDYFYVIHPNGSVQVTPDFYKA